MELELNDGLEDKKSQTEEGNGQAFVLNWIEQNNYIPSIDYDQIYILIVHQ